MELGIDLKSQNVQNRVREVGINPNYWYPVSWADKLKPGEIRPVMVWKHAIALFRDADGRLGAIEDACPHKGVALHKGQVEGENLRCPYHGWAFDDEGRCVDIPYLPEGQKLPRACARSYPVRERYNLIWVFPGDRDLAETTPLPEVPEFDDPDWVMVPIPAHFQAHFSICNENTMDVFHGYLHKNLQGWFDPVLIDLKEGDGEVSADYRVSYQGWITKFLGLSDRGDRVTTRTISIRYRYPHYRSSLEGISSIYLMRLPVTETETRSFSMFFLKVRLPQKLLQPIKPQLSQFIWRFLFKPFLDQDIEMVESEQRTYSANPQRRYVEINPAIIALQRVIVRQYEQFVQQSGRGSIAEPSPSNAHSQTSASEAGAIASNQTEFTH